MNRVNTFFNDFIECILQKNGVKTSWAMIALEEDEWELYVKQRNTYSTFLKKYLGSNEENIKEWDYFNPEKHFTPAICEPVKLIKKGLILIEDEIQDNSIKKSFKEGTEFIKGVLNFTDSDYLILISLREIEREFKFETPDTIAHETIHIVNLYKEGMETHEGECVDKEGWKYADLCKDHIPEIFKEAFLKYSMRNGVFRIK